MKVAILIPTMNRPEFVKRTLAYYNSLASPHPIYIGDASEPAVFSDIEAFAQQCINVRVKCFNWERLPISATCAKLGEVALAECEYCAIIGDDDYFIPASLSLCANFLSKNPGYRTAQGRAALFTLDRAGPFGEIRSVGDYWGVNELEQETAVDRLRAFQENYFVTQFSTHRTHEFVQDSQYYKDIRDDAFGELLHCFTFAIKGRSKFLDCLYMIRSSHEGNVHPGFLDWVTRGAWAIEYRELINGLSAALEEVSDLSFREAEKVVSGVFRSRFERQIDNESLGRANRRKASIVLKIKQLAPAVMKRAIRELISEDHDMRILRSKRSKFYRDFQPVMLSLERKSIENL